MNYIQTIVAKLSSLYSFETFSFDFQMFWRKLKRQSQSYYVSPRKSWEIHCIMHHPEVFWKEFNSFYKSFSMVLIKETMKATILSI
jgi:hypothetical protein